jgi:hypothetical protein
LGQAVWPVAEDLILGAMIKDAPSPPTLQDLIELISGSARATLMSDPGQPLLDGDATLAAGGVDEVNRLEAWMWLDGGCPKGPR